MPEPFVIKRGDLGRPVEMWVVPDTDVTGATVDFSMRRADTLQVVIARAPAQIVQVNPGKLRYPFAAGQTDQEGEYEFEFRLTRDGLPLTAPSAGYYPLLIKANL